MHNLCDVALSTRVNGADIAVHGQRAASYVTLPTAGFRDLRAAGCHLTGRRPEAAPCISISHGNVNGIGFGCSPGCSAEPEEGRIVSQGFTARRGSQSAGFRHEMDWSRPSGEHLLSVALVARAAAAACTGLALDLSIRFAAGEHDEVLLGETSEGLLRACLQPALLPSGGGHARNSHGDMLESELDGRRAPWFGCIGVIDSQTVGVSLIDHPDNPTHPPSWHVDPGGVVMISPFETCSITLLPLESVTLRFRIQTYCGYVDDGWTALRAQEFSREPLRL